ncbi:hypothetical protein CPB85DRAFT_18768 [Mucidula mucida]|nr:hypothetical protein CPB85DRAFT_18768 [Mucidula mucida]
MNAYLSQLRSRLGWNAIRKKYFPPTQWSINEMLAWLDGYWQYTHSELPSLKDYDFYMGANGISGTMCGLDVRLAVLHDDLRGIYDRMIGREGEGSDVGKAIKEGLKWSGKHEWEKKRQELEKQGEALRKVQREEERSLKRKLVDDEDYDDEGAARQVPRARVVSAPQPQSKKRGRSESPESEDDGDSTPPPPAKRHCSLPTMSLSTPPDLANWFKVQTPMSTWDAPVTLKAFSYGTMPMPSLVDDDSDSERGSSVGREYPFVFGSFSFVWFRGAVMVFCALVSRQLWPIRTQASVDGKEGRKETTSFHFKCFYIPWSFICPFSAISIVSAYPILGSILGQMVLFGVGPLRFIFQLFLSVPFR